MIILLQRNLSLPSLLIFFLLLLFFLGCFFWVLWFSIVILVGLFRTSLTTLIRLFHVSFVHQHFLQTIKSTKFSFLLVAFCFLLEPMFASILFDIPSNNLIFISLIQVELLGIYVRFWGKRMWEGALVTIFSDFTVINHIKLHLIECIAIIACLLDKPTSVIPQVWRNLLRLNRLKNVVWNRILSWLYLIIDCRILNYLWLLGLKLLSVLE